MQIREAVAKGGGCVETLRLIVQRRDFNFVGDLRAELVGMPTWGASGGASASWLALTFDGYE
jgi:hypothetical protein